MSGNNHLLRKLGHRLVTATQEVHLQLREVTEINGKGFLCMPCFWCSFSRAGCPSKFWHWFSVPVHFLLLCYCWVQRSQTACPFMVNPLVVSVCRFVVKFFSCFPFQDVLSGFVLLARYAHRKGGPLSLSIIRVTPLKSNFILSDFII